MASHAAADDVLLTPPKTRRAHDVAAFVAHGQWMQASASSSIANAANAQVQASSPAISNTSSALERKLLKAMNRTPSSETSVPSWHTVADGPLTPCTRNAVKLIPHATTPVRKCPKQDNLNWSPGPALTPPWSMSTPMPKMGKTWKASVKKTAAKVRKFRSSGRRSCTKTKSKSKTPGPEPRQLNLTFAFDSNP